MGALCWAMESTRLLLVDFAIQVVVYRSEQNRLWLRWWKNKMCVTLT